MQDPITGKNYIMLQTGFYNLTQYLPYFTDELIIRKIVTLFIFPDQQ